MKKALKTKWVKALRSGKFAQAKGVLRDGNTGGYCCLGVLRELIRPGSTAEDPSFSALCATHSKMVGLPRYAPDVDDNIQNALATMNDEGKTFAEIADYIEANL